MKYCNCFKVLDVRSAILDLHDEVCELIDTPNRDELSDVAFAINRLVGAIFNRKYIRVIPYDKRHWDKISLRMVKHSCIRSLRHKVIHY